MRDPGFQGSFRADQRRYQRDERARQREIERKLKEQAKLSELQQAELEVEAFENQLALLLSVHKEQGETWDWRKLAYGLPAPLPRRMSYHEVGEVFRIAMLQAQRFPTSQDEASRGAAQDEKEYRAAVRLQEQERAEQEKLKGLARRVLRGDHKAYVESLVELSPLAEVSSLGSSIHFSVHSTRTVEAVIKVNGVQVIPCKIKSLTAGGKLSVKAMPKARFHELYQDYLCSCMLRVGREVFALLPVDSVLVTAVADLFETETGKDMETPVLSVAFPRQRFGDLHFDRVDPSDALESFMHRGDFKASRKAGAFMGITPLSPDDLPAAPENESLSLCELVAGARQLSGEIRKDLDQLIPSDSEPSEEKLS